jgi:hypothetical protein
VSPRSLAISAHHRAVWDLLPLSFCPESRETLIDACPMCKRVLRWRRTLGVAFCEHCVDEDGEPTVDLRDFPQPLIDVADEAALDLAIDLVRPGIDRIRALTAVAGPFRAFDAGDLFEAVVAVACAATTEPDAPRGIMRRMKTLDDFKRITPSALATGARVLTDWPRAFHDLADRVRSQASLRPGHYGVRKELGPLLMLGRDQHLATGIKALVRAEVDRNMAQSAGQRASLRRADNHRDETWITAQAAAERFGTAPGSSAALPGGRT